MKSETEIAAMVEDTLDLATHVAAVSAPKELKAKIQARLGSADPVILHPKWLRHLLTAAAAIVILAVNVLTIKHFVHHSGNGGATQDPFDQIRAQYSLNSTDF